MPHGHMHPSKSKNQAKRENEAEPRARSMQPEATTQEPKATTKGQDVHREIPEQRADWEGMAPQSSQVTASHPETSEDENSYENQEPSEQDAVEGEGSYSGTRQYNEGLQRSMAAGKTEAGAKAAKKALDGPEGDALRRAERQGKSGSPKRSS